MASQEKLSKLHIYDASPKLAYPDHARSCAKNFFSLSPDVKCNCGVGNPESTQAELEKTSR